MYSLVVSAGRLTVVASGSSRVVQAPLLSLYMNPWEWSLMSSYLPTISFPEMPMAWVVPGYAAGSSRFVQAEPLYRNPCVSPVPVPTL